MSELSLTEAVVYALDNMPGEIMGVYVAGERAHISLKDAGGVYTCDVKPCEREQLKQTVRERRARRWEERAKAGTL